MTNSLHDLVVLSDSVSLYRGDCRDILPTLGRVDAVVTDPPYGMALDARFANSTPNPAKGIGASKGYANIVGDDEPFDPTPVLSLAREVFLWGADYYRDKLPAGGSWLVWDKREGIEQVEYSASEFELCWSKVKRHRRILRQRWFGLCGTETQDVRTRVHPAQKPVQLLAWLLDMTDAATVLDPYMGSGSTGIACIRTGRKFIGIEKDARYFEIARARLENELRQGLLPLKHNNALHVQPGLEAGGQ